MEKILVFILLFCLSCGPESNLVIDQEVNLLPDGSYCMETWLWQIFPMEIIGHWTAQEHYRYWGEQPSKGYWFVKSVTDSVKLAHYHLADSAMREHIRKISPLSAKDRYNTRPD